MNLEISIEYSDDCCDCCDCEEDSHHRCGCEYHREEKWNEDEVRSTAKQCADAVFSHLDIKSNAVEICFLFTDDETVRLLNKTYRGIDKPTNVLSFPADPIESLDSYDNESESDNYSDYDFKIDEENTDAPKPFLILGSMALAHETVEREAVEQNKKFADHLRHLIVHSLLHLLNYDHTEEVDAEEMESLEIAILNKMGISNPYELN